MAEKAETPVSVAEPVVEKAEAPSTPSEDVSTPKKQKMSYDPDKLPKPTTVPDFLMHANLVEARAQRSATNDLVKAIERVADTLEAMLTELQKSNTPVKK